MESMVFCCIISNLRKDKKRKDPIQGVKKTDQCTGYLTVNVLKSDNVGQENPESNELRGD
jgi:hypothetical protein